MTGLSLVAIQCICKPIDGLQGSQEEGGGILLFIPKQPRGRESQKLWITLEDLKWQQCE